MDDETKQGELKKAEPVVAAPVAPAIPPLSAEDQKKLAELEARKAATPLSPVEEKQMADMLAHKKMAEAPVVKGPPAIPHGPLRVAKEMELAAKEKQYKELPAEIAALKAELAPQPPMACVALAMGGVCPACGYVRGPNNLEPHPVV